MVERYVYMHYNVVLRTDQSFVVCAWSGLISPFLNSYLLKSKCSGLDFLGLCVQCTLQVRSLIVLFGWLSVFVLLFFQQSN